MPIRAARSTGSGPSASSTVLSERPSNTCMTIQGRPRSSVTTSCTVMIPG